MMDFFISAFNFSKTNWLIFAFLAPMFWAVVNLIDVYFVGTIYKNETEGAIIVLELKTE